MAKSSTSDADTSSAPSYSSTVLILGTVADTTWRLFVPTIGGTIIGIIIDNIYGTKPWATIIGVSVGTALSIGLIYLQIRKVQK